MKYILSPLHPVLHMYSPVKYTSNLSLLTMSAMNWRLPLLKKGTAWSNELTLWTRISWKRNEIRKLVPTSLPGPLIFPLPRTREYVKIRDTGKDVEHVISILLLLLHKFSSNFVCYLMEKFITDQYGCHSPHDRNHNVLRWNEILVTVTQAHTLTQRCVTE